jgi:carboxypeptidase C (cathepsin A)
LADPGLHPCQYAGTFNTGAASSHPDDDHNLFYWFFRHPDPKAPLVLWINGGPGATSMFGLFLENGPLRVERFGPNLDDLRLKPAVNSWADTYNIVFLD